MVTQNAVLRGPQSVDRPTAFTPYWLQAAGEVHPQPVAVVGLCEFHALVQPIGSENAHIEEREVLYATSKWWTCPAPA